MRLSATRKGKSFLISRKTERIGKKLEVVMAVNAKIRHYLYPVKRFSVAVSLLPIMVEMAVVVILVPQKQLQF